MPTARPADAIGGRVRFRSASFEYQGHRLHFDEYGEGDRLLVYLHGLLIDSAVNRGIAAALAARGEHVVLLDLLGHGRSAKPRHASAYRIDTYPAQVFALLDAIGAEQAVLGGMSLGANVSLFAAVQRPERVRGLVCEMPVLEWAVPAAAVVFVPMLLFAHYARPIAGVTATVAQRLPDTGVDTVDALLHGAALPPAALAALLHGVLAGPVAPTFEDRCAVDVPAIVLAHRNDVLHPFDDAANLAAQLANAELVRARSPLELRLAPHRLTDRIATFLDAVWEPGGADRSAAALVGP